VTISFSNNILNHGVSKDYAVGRFSNGITFIQNFVKIRPLVRKVIGGHTDSMVISKAIFLFVLRNESNLTRRNGVSHGGLTRCPRVQCVHDTCFSNCQ
jgi:hypothetical protein